MKRRPEGEVFATLVKEVYVSNLGTEQAYQVYGEPPVCPEYVSYHSQWGYVFSDTPIEQGQIIILKTNKHDDSFTRIYEREEN